MRISFFPQRRDDALVLEKSSGDRLRINGELFNFNPLADGDTIPSGAVPCDFVVGPVERIDGEVCIILVLPYRVSRMGVEPPDPIAVEVDGAIVLPNIDPAPQPDEPADVEP